MSERTVGDVVAAGELPAGAWRVRLAHRGELATARHFRRRARFCHSDIHVARGEWGKVPYPAVPGHEIAGIVAEVGSQVTRFAPGDRVGCMVDSCGECANCEAGEEQCRLPGNTQSDGSIDRNGTITRGPGGTWRSSSPMPWEPT